MRHDGVLVQAVAAAVLVGIPAGGVLAGHGEVLSHAKISDTEGGFDGKLHDGDHFAGAVAVIGDLDGDGVDDLAVAETLDDDKGALNRGAIWILLLNPDSTVKANLKITSLTGGFPEVLDGGDYFGRSLAPLGDLDGDNVFDLAVGARGDDDGGSSRGAVYMLFLDTDGTVLSIQKISSTEGGFTGTLDSGDHLGWSTANLGDLDGDGVVDLAVAALDDDDGGLDRGAIYVLFLNDDGTVKAHQKISATEGGFTGTLHDTDHFGQSLSALGDLDGDGVMDLAVGASQDDDGGLDRGAVWILFLNDDGTVKDHQKISQTTGGFTGSLDDDDEFGWSVGVLCDLDGDAVAELAVGARLDDDGGADRGAVWVLFLNADGTVKAHQKISSTEGNFTGDLDNIDEFGASVASLGDRDGDGVCDLAIGAWHDGDGGPNHGALWIMFLAGCPWDVDGSGVVATGDLLALLGEWGSDPGGPPDFDGDGTVSSADLLALLSHWGPCP